jgi:hypothetical protein
VNSDQVITEPQIKINHQPEKIQQEDKQQTQQNVPTMNNTNEEVSNQPRNSASFPDLKHPVVEVVAEQDKKERRHTVVQLN